MLIILYNNNKYMCIYTWHLYVASTKFPSFGLHIDKLTTALLFSTSNKTIGVFDCIRILSIDVSNSTESEYDASSSCKAIL